MVITWHGVLKRLPIREIIQSAEGDIALVDCVNGKLSKKKKGECPSNGSCVTQTVWKEATDRLNEYFESLTLKNPLRERSGHGSQKGAGPPVCLFHLIGFVLNADLPKGAIMHVLMSKNILEQIGNTPLVRLEKMEEKGAAAIYAKVEAFNPGGSIKAPDMSCHDRGG